MGGERLSLQIPATDTGLVAEVRIVIVMKVPYFAVNMFAFILYIFGNPWLTQNYR